MATKMSVHGFDDYFEKLDQIGSEANRIAKQALYEGAGIVADAVRAGTPKDSGDLASSLYIAEFTVADGDVRTKIGFAGYDSNGTPNQLKANVLESGRSAKAGGIVGKKPFVRPAFSSVKDKYSQTVIAECEKKFREIMED